MDRAIGWYIGVKMLFKKFYLIQCLRNVGICTSIAGVPNPAPAVDCPAQFIFNPNQTHLPLIFK